MKVTPLSSEHHQEQYTKFVAAQDSGSFLQSWSWGDFQASLGREVIRYGVFADDDVDDETKNEGQTNLIASIQLLRTKILHLPGYYSYAPYGPVVKDEVDSETANTAVNLLIDQAKSDLHKDWFIRIEPKNEIALDGKPSMHIQPGSTLITDISVSTEELLTSMHQKTRYNIKVAAKHEVVVSSGNKPSKHAIDLLVKTSHRQGYKSHTASYYETLLNYFSESSNEDCKVRLYEATHNGQCIASAIMIDFGNTRTYLFGGSNNDARNLMAPYALHWKAINDAKEIGLTHYDWWGTETASGAAPGFVQFKLRWGGTQKFYAGTRDIVLNSNWYKAYNVMRKANRLFK